MLREADLDGVRYEIYNYMSMLYMSVDSVSGDWITQNVLDSNDSKRWLFEPDGNGYYTIRSTLDPLYVGITSVSIGTDNIRLFSSIQDSTKWKVYLTALDEFVIEPKNAPGKLLSAVSNEVEDKLQLQFMGIQNIYGREWELIHKTYTITITHYYDEAFDVKVYDHLGVINTHQNRCAELLMRLYDINLVCTSIKSYTSSGDDCPQRHDLGIMVDEACVCGYIDHRSKVEIINKFSNDVLEDVADLKVLWTGYLANERAFTEYTIGNIYMTNIFYGDDFSSAIFLHEISHNLGTPDHYCYYEADNDPNNDNENCNNPFEDCYKCDHQLSEKPICLMSTTQGWNLRNELSDEEIFELYCNKCRMDIRNYLEMHY